MTVPPGVATGNAPAADPAAPGQQDVQPASGSPAVQSVQPPVSSPPTTQGKGNDFMRNAISAMRAGRYPVEAPEAPPAESAESKAERSEAPSGKVPTSAEGAPATPAAPASAAAPSPPAALTLTQEELDRRVQAETDRRLAKFQREEGERRKKQEEVELRRTDPFEYARRMETAEQEQEKLRTQNQQLTSYVATHMTAYDQGVLDPLMLKLPKTEQDRLLKEIDPEGVPGRARLAQAALSSLEKHYEQQGIQKARQTLLNDQAFIKEVLARHGGRRVETEPAPAMAAASPNGFNMNDWIRGTTPSRA